MIGWFTEVYLSKDYEYYNICIFRKDILDSLFDGYDAWISPSFDKSESPNPHPHPQSP